MKYCSLHHTASRPAVVNAPPVARRLERSVYGRLRVPARLAGAVAVYDAALRQIVGGELDVYSVARKYPDSVPAQASRDVGKDDVAVLQFDGEGRAWKDLFDRAGNLQGSFFDDLGRLALGHTLSFWSSIARGD
jgi:hypothetical protein